MRHRNGFDQTSHNNIRMQQQPIYSPSNHHQYSNNNHFNHQSNSGQYGSPNLSANSSLHEQQSMIMNMTTSTPESAPHLHNGHRYEQSPRRNIHSLENHQNGDSIPPPPPPPLPSQLEPMNHMLQYPTARQSITRPMASPPPPPPPPPPTTTASVRN